LIPLKTSITLNLILPSLKQFKLFFLIAVFTGLLLTCQRHSPPDNYLARVDETYLTTDDLEFLSIMKPDGKIPKGQLRSFVNNWVETELLAQQSMKQDLDEDPVLRSRLESYRKKLLADMYIRHEIYRTISISDQDIRDYYKQHRQSFIREHTGAEVTHYFATNSDTANQVYNILRNGSPEERSLLYQRNTPETKIVSRQEMVPALADAIFGTQALGLLDPVETSRGFHVVQVKQRFSAGEPKPIDQVRDEIRERILIQKQKQHYYQVLDSLKGVVDIEINKEEFNQVSSDNATQSLP